MSDRPWEQLASSDVPRSLPPTTRAALESLLLARAVASDEVGLAGIDAPRALPTGLRTRLEGALLAGRQPRRRAVTAWLAVAAAAAVVAVAVPVLGRPSSGGTHVAGRPASAPSPTEESAAPGTGLAGAGSTSGGGVALPPPHATPAATTTQQGEAAVVAGEAPAPAAASPPPGEAPVTPAAPRVTGLSPTHGPTTGGTWVTIQGTALSGATQVVFGTGAPASRVEVVSAGEIRALSPSHLPGEVDVQVTTPGGTSPVTSADRYLYLA